MHQTASLIYHSYKFFLLRMLSCGIFLHLPHISGLEESFLTSTMVLNNFLLSKGHILISQLYLGIARIHFFWGGY